MRQYRSHPMKHKVQRIYFIGIGGSGMNGIAEILFNLGYQIAGSDISENAAVQHLKALGIPVFNTHHKNNILVTAADVVVVSTAIKENNPELQIAKELKIPIVPRAQMLAEIMRLRWGIAIAGTHGKTTTTSLVASVLTAANLAPGFVIGGKLNSAGVNAQICTDNNEQAKLNDFLVVEADESDASFLFLSPMLSVVTNIDADHMDTYEHNFEKLKMAFVDFLHRLPFYGVCVLCGEDKNVVDILPKINRKKILYGFEDNNKIKNDIYAKNIQAKFGGQMEFDCFGFYEDKQKPLKIVLNLAGKHNVLNALAAIAVAAELQIPDEIVQKALAEFKGVGRRFESYGEITLTKNSQQVKFTLIDDYGHHPVEMAATLAAVRGAYPQNRLVLLFQPHRYTRTRDCFDDFVKVLSSVDALILSQVYAAGELPIIAANSHQLARSLRIASDVNPVVVENVDDMIPILENIVKDGDIVLTMGAGNIGNLAGKIREIYANK